jgi:hypothetical protein
MQRPGAQPDAVAPSGGAFRRDMPQRVSPGITVKCGVLGPADTE